MTSFFSIPQRDRMLDYVKDMLKKKIVSPISTEAQDKETLNKRIAGSVEDLKDNAYLQKKAAEIITQPLRNAAGDLYADKKKKAQEFLNSLVNDMKKKADEKINQLLPTTTIRYDFSGQPVTTTEQKNKQTATPTPIEKVQAAEPTPTPAQRQIKVATTDTARNPAIKRFAITNDVHDAIQSAAKQYGVPSSLLYDIALQENSFDPSRVNTSPDAVDADGNPLHPTGLFQFTDKTWHTVLNYEASPGSTLKLPNHDRTDPYTNAAAAAYLIAHGQLGRWDASKNVWGQYYTDKELQPYYAQTLNRKDGE